MEITKAEATEVLIIGAGPAGLHAACVCQDLGLTHRIVDRRGLAHSFVEYPQTLRFFSPPDEMEVGGVPLPMRGGEKPTREDILPYFRAVAAYRKLNLSLWERIVEVRHEGEGFLVRTLTEPNGDEARLYRARFVVLSSGVWDQPIPLDVPGGDLPHVLHRFYDPTEYFGMPVLVVGGGNSAVGAALSLVEARAQVAMSVRFVPAVTRPQMRPFITRDLQFVVEEGKLALHAPTRVVRVEPQQVWLQSIAEYSERETGPGEVVPTGDPYPVPARFVFALIGQTGDTDFLQRLGLCLEPDARPQHDAYYETNVPGLFVIGSLAGRDINIVIRLREQAEEVIRTIATRLPFPR